MSAPNPVPRHPLRLRLQQILLVCILASLILTIGLSQLSQSYFSRHSLIAELKAVGNLLGNRSIAAIIFADRQAASVNLNAARDVRSIIRLCLYDQDRQLFSSYYAIPAQRSPVDSCEEQLTTAQINRDYEFFQNTVQLALKIDEKNESYGYLLIDGSLSQINKEIQQSLIILIGTFLLAILLAWLLSRSLLRKALRPLQQLHQHTQAVSRDPFANNSEQPLINDRNDEVSDLVSAYATMLNTIQHEHHQLQVSEARFRGLAENSPIGIYLQSSLEQFTYVNSKWQEITDCDSGIDHDDFQRYIHPADRSSYRKKRADAFQSGENTTIEYRFFSPKTGEKRVLMEYISPITNRHAPKEHSGLIGSVLDISALKNAQTELEHLAFYDALTDLPNRRFFRDHLDSRIAAAQKDGSELTIMMIDLDNFKAINDSMGHDAGDTLLKEIGFRLRSQIFTEDVVARLGGDEFIILLEHTGDPTEIAHIVQKLLKATTEPLLIQQQTVEVSCSIGLARFPVDANTSQDIIHHADIAMYQAKSRGKNRAEYFSSELNTEIQERIKLERKLRIALQEDALEIYLQPQYDLNRHSFYWAEALIRWNDSEAGFISPDRFIPIAEDAGLIIDLGQWVCRQVCQLLAREGKLLAQAGIQGVAINLSAQEFYHKNLIGYLSDLLAEFKISAEQLEFELTESMVMEDVSRAIQTMQDLQGLGCRISLDDFGTGYSSLSYLKKFNINQLKIDKSFVDGLPHDKNDEAITGAILAMASKLGLDVIAEGIETIEQSEFLLARGCSLMQGYLYAKPMPVHKLLELCRREVLARDLTRQI